MLFRSVTAGDHRDLHIEAHSFPTRRSSDLVEEGQRAPGSNAVDGKNVPAFHFGLVLSMERWRGLADRLRGAGVEFLIEPYVRNEGEVGEQATLFVRDPAGNALEFKAFDDLGQLFAT